MPALPPGPNIAAVSTFRTDRWPSRNHAATSFRRNRLFGSFHPDVLEKYLTYGLREVRAPSSTFSSGSTHPSPSGQKDDVKEEAEKPVTLTTPVAQEVFSFVRTNFQPSFPLTPRQRRLLHPNLAPSHARLPFTRPECANILTSLPAVRPHVLYVFSAQSIYLPSSVQEELVTATGTGVGGNGGVAEGAIEKILVSGGHFAPFVTVDEMAGVLAERVGKEAKRWVEEKEWLESFDSGKSERNGGTIVVSEEFKASVGGDARRRGGKL
ncbi:MAG: hypothetical protein Q9222_006303 [Ikaeria aurantiellina]